MFLAMYPVYGGILQNALHTKKKILEGLCAKKTR